VKTKWVAIGISIAIFVILIIALAVASSSKCQTDCVPCICACLAVLSALTRSLSGDTHDVLHTHANPLVTAAESGSGTSNNPNRASSTPAQIEECMVKQRVKYNPKLKGNVC